MHNSDAGSGAGSSNEGEDTDRDKDSTCGLRFRNVLLVQRLEHRRRSSSTFNAARIWPVFISDVCKLLLVPLLAGSTKIYLATCSLNVLWGLTMLRQTKFRPVAF